MTEPTVGPGGVTEEQYRAALDVIRAAGVSVADAEPGLRALGQVDVRRRTAIQPPDHRCHRCQASATAQWQRYATAEEAETWHAGREQWFRQHNDGSAEAEYVSDRSDTVTMAVHGCDDHDLSPAPADDTNAAAYEARQIGADRRVLTHDADCGGHGMCGCEGGA